MGVGDAGGTVGVGETIGMVGLSVGLMIARAVGLGDRADHTPNELSGGQQQRVAIARALANEPAILLADEPTANLDTESSNQIVELFRELNEQQEQTIIMVTHEPDLGEKADRIVRLKDGRAVL